MPQLIELSHPIEEGMETYPGLPAPHICDYWSREESRSNYQDGSEFQIGEITMVANTGTYLDTPFHRFADGKDLSQIKLEQLAALAAVRVKCQEQAIEAAVFALDKSTLKQKAILLETGWSQYWRTEKYKRDHPFLSVEAAQYLVDAQVSLVGIDSLNIDDTRTATRPVHTLLLKSGIVIVEHMTNLHQLPDDEFRFYATPPKIVGMGTFPVRAFAQIE